MNVVRQGWLVMHNELQREPEVIATASLPYYMDCNLSIHSGGTSVPSDSCESSISRRICELALTLNDCTTLFIRLRLRRTPTTIVSTAHCFFKASISAMKPLNQPASNLSACVSKVVHGGIWQSAVNLQFVDFQERITIIAELANEHRFILPRLLSQRRVRSRRQMND